MLPWWFLTGSPPFKVASLQCSRPESRVSMVAGAGCLWLDCRAMTRLLVLMLLAAVAEAGNAQPEHGWELGARYWLGTGTTKLGHNAQGVAPSLGNPTSVLTYEGLNSHAVELHGRLGFGQRWFIRGNAGLGSIRKGWFDDEDFAAGQAKLSDSTSSVKGNRLTYLTIDVGRELWTLAGGTTIGVFAGYNRWTERADANGAFFSVNGFGSTNIDESVRVITNEVTSAAPASP